MLTIAYLANQFPSPVEPYVVDEINELRSRGVRVIASSVRKPCAAKGQTCAPGVILQPVSIWLLLRSAGLCLRKWSRIAPLLRRAIVQGREPIARRLKALLHTWLGACYALMLEQQDISHIHVHHGYFGSWIAMTAARFLDVSFSMTLHGSDVLLSAAYLDIKLANCLFCLTVSDYNRRFILENYSDAHAKKIIVSRLGVALDHSAPQLLPRRNSPRFHMVAVGRLHAVKNHAFLVRACAQLHEAGVDFECSIAGDGPERRRLESLIQELGLAQEVTLLGHVRHEQLGSLYDRADLVVLTSRSEGLPLVLMEAMARGKIVLAPAITGIPELVIPGKTGFLYQPEWMDDFISRILLIRSLSEARNCKPHSSRRLEWVSHAARVHILHNFNREKNLQSFSDLLLSRIGSPPERLPYEDLVLQQI